MLPKLLLRFRRTCYCKWIGISTGYICFFRGYIIQIFLLIWNLRFRNRVRRHVQELLNSIRNDSKHDYDRQLNIRISQLTKFLPDPVKASEFLCKFSTDLKNDKVLYRTMETIVSPSTDCKTCAEQTVYLPSYLLINEIKFNSTSFLFCRTLFLKNLELQWWQICIIIPSSCCWKELLPSLWTRKPFRCDTFLC